MNTRNLMRHEDYDYLAFKALQRGEFTLTESERGLLYGVSNEQRDLGYQSGADGLFLAPETVDNVAQSVLTEANVFRRLGRVIKTVGHTVATPMAVTKPAGAATEYDLTTGEVPSTPDTALTFGLVNHATNAAPSYYSIGMVTNRVSIRVSQELLEDSANGGVDVVEQIALSGAMALAEQELNVFFNALGINGTTRLTTSMGIKGWSGADAARRLTFGVTSVTVPNQIAAITALGSQYAENATLLISPKLFSNFSGISANTIQRELTWFGTPTVFSTRFSATYTAGNMNALYGDFRYFVVADHVSGLMINRYDEIAAGTGQVVFTISKRFGGGITNDLAFRSIVL